MTESESRALARTTAVLLVAAALRWGASARGGPPLVPPDSATALTALLEESTRERETAALRSAPLAEGEMLDPNQASEIDFDRLPGVGPATARALVAAREERGAFVRPEDLLTVPGIGPATLARMLPHLDFSRAPPAAGGGPQGGGYGARGVGAPGSAAARSGASDAGAAVLDLNRASHQELERLPGIGPALSERIVEERTRRGGFLAVEDLLEVRGIGPATLERLRPLVSVR